MRVAIVEDDPQVRQTLTGYVHRYERQYGVTVDLTVFEDGDELVSALPAEQRVIRAAIFPQKGFVMFRFENCCPDPVSFGEDGLPLTGYGVRAMQSTAARYGGTLTVHWEDGWFTLRVLLPLPK